MNRQNLIAEVRRRAADLDGEPNALNRFAYPLNDASLSMANTDAIDEATPEYAVFTASDGGIDRDGDHVNVHNVRTDNFQAAGAPILFSHGTWPVPIGSAINPDGELDVWVEGDRLKVRVWWDLADPQARYIAGKVRRGVLRGMSIAFVPLEHRRRDDYEKAETHHGRLPPGFDFLAVDLTEISITPTPSNPRAVADAPAALRKCFSGWCRPSPPPDDPLRQEALAILKGIKRYLSKNTQADLDSGPRPPVNGPQCGCKGCRQLGGCPCSKACPCAKVLAGVKGKFSTLRKRFANWLLTEILNCHKDRRRIAQELKSQWVQLYPRLEKELLLQSLGYRAKAQELTGKLDEMEDVDISPDVAEILARYSDDEEDMDVEELLDLYRHPSARRAERDRQDRTEGHHA